MTEDEALTLSMGILSRSHYRALNKKDAAELKKLEPFIQKDKMGDLWEAYLVTCDEFDCVIQKENE